MYCEVCKKIPLDVFLPSLYHRRGGRQQRFQGTVQHSKDVPGGQTALERLKEFATAGCEICQLLQSALDNSGPPPGIGVATKPNNVGLNLNIAYTEVPFKVNHPGDPGIMLYLNGEGILEVLDGKRSGTIKWTIPSLGTGYKRSQTLAKRSTDPELSQQCRQWLETCEQTHKFCLESNAQYSPPCLVEIEGDGQAACVRLVRSPATSVKYTALSYCADRGQGIVPTVKANFDARLSSIPSHELCQTFRDAIHMTTTLGLKHVWIDALCTIKDDPENFEMNWKEMNHILKGAWVTLAASSARHGQEGFLHDREASVVSGLTFSAKNNRWVILGQGIMSGHLGRADGNPDDAEVTIFPAFRPWMQSIQGPLSTRAWAFQERELSPRVLHFTADRVLWECRECFAAEEEPEMRSKAKYNKDAPPSLSPLRALDSNGQNSPTETPFLASTWLKLMRTYARTKLSVPAEKLVAVAGLAKEFANNSSNERYLAGNWQSNLLESLAWFPDHEATAEPAQATLENAVVQLSLTNGQHLPWPPAQADTGTPSWSWASFSDAIWFWGSDWFAGGWKKVVLENGETKYEKRNESAKVLESLIDNKSEKYGPVNGGSILILGQAVEVDLSEEEFDADLSKDWIRKVYLTRLSLKKEPTVAESQLRRALELVGMERYAPPSSEKPGVADETPIARTSLSVYFDHDPQELPPSKFLCIKLGSGKPPRGGKPDKDCGLVLMPSQRKPGSYQRVGMFDVLSSEDIWNARKEMKEVDIV